jgi:hypothetical protein
MNKQSSKVNVRRYKFYCSVYSFYCSVYPIVLSDIHFTALLTPLYCLTFTSLLFLPQCIVWHSLYCCLFILLLCLFILSKMNKQSSKMNKKSNTMNVRQYNEVNSSKVNVRQYNGVNRAVKWISDNTLGIFWHSFYSSVYPIAWSDIHFTALFTPLYCLTFTLLLCLFILLLCLPHCIVWHSLYNNEVNRAVKWMSDNTMR